jgi:MSHA biogenesis protein MshN
VVAGFGDVACLRKQHRLDDVYITRERYVSLINQMLQDLEKRRASGAERGALPNQVRALPHEHYRGISWWLMGVAAVVVLIALVAWSISRLPSSPVTPSVAQIPHPAAPPAVIPETPASDLALNLQQVPASAPRQPDPPPAPAAHDKPAPQGPRTETSRKKPALPPAVATAAVVMPNPPAAQTPQTAGPRTEPSQPLAPSAEPLKPVVVAPPAVSAPAPVVSTRPTNPAPAIVAMLPESKGQAAPVNPQINKRTQEFTPQQVAENDFREATNLMNQGRLPEAELRFKRILQNNSAHAGARQALFGLLIEARKKGEAEQLLQDGLAFDPNQAGFAMALSSLQYERGDVAGAIDTMQKFKPAAQASPDYLARLAGLLQRQSRHKEAVDNYQAALRLAPGSGVWWMGLGISLQASNRNAEAQDAFRRAGSSNSLTPELQSFVDQRMKQSQ